MLHGGNIVVRALEDMGVEVVFGVPGEHTAFFYDAVSRSSKLHHVLMRDECHCVCAADAYARASRKLGVCDSTVGPGSSKLVSGLAEAYNSSTAILAIVGGYRFETSHFIGKGRVSQGISQEDYLKPVCKKVFTVNCAEQLYDVIRHAAVCACTGVCGPVAVIISTDIFSERRLTPPEHNVPCPKAVFPMFPVTAPRESIREASGLIAGASRPVFLAGGGVMGSGAERILSDLAERFVIPIATSFSGKGAVREDHPLCLGFSGKMGIPTNEKLLRKSDLIILVGTKAGENTSYDWTFPDSSQRVVQINIDPEEMLSYCNGSCCLVGDCRLVLEALYEELAQSEQADREEWVKLVQTARSEWFALKKAEEVPAGALLSPQQVMRKLQDIFDERTCIVSDASFSSSWVAEFIVQTQIGRRCFFPRGLALLGWALPAAVGICETGLYDRVIVVAGDGGFSYSLSELATVAEHEYPILSVVLNNSSLGWYRIIHTIYFSEGESETGKSKHLAFDAIARGYGIPSASTDQYEKLCAEIDRFSAYSGPAVLNIDTHWQSTPIWSLRQELEKMQPSDL